MTLIVTWLWQGLAIAWITAIAVRAMPRLNAATRHAIWWLALAAVLAVPGAHGLAAMIAGTPSAAGLPPLDAAGSLLLPAIPDGVVAGAAAIWAMTAVGSVLRIARSCRALGRMKRASTPFDPVREGRLPLWVAARHGRHRAAELRTSDRVTGACALGLGRPAILISRAVAEALGDESLDEIVMHEQAHLDRYDDWSQLLLAVVGSVVGLHPAVRFLARRLDVDREAACDDRVVSCTGATRRYASALLTVAAASNPEADRIEFAAGAPAAAATASALRVRVSRLLDPRRDRDARLAGVPSLAIVAALALAVVTATQMAPAVVFLDAVDVSAPAAARAADVTREPEQARNVDSPASVIRTPPRRPITRIARPTPFEPPEAAVYPFETATLDALPAAAPLDSRAMGADGRAPVIGERLPSGQLAALVSAPAQAAPWDAVTASTTSAAGDVARAAAATGARAKSAGLSIGRFFTRASKAGANAF
jgi:beta-lactamase regulating signal transducer with metallopeptidase domain